MASRVIESLSNEGKVSLLVGGTGLYADSLIKGIDFSKDSPADENYRKEIMQLSNERGNLYVHSLLKEVDPKSADLIHPNNIKRVIRALEYYHASGERISDYNERSKLIPPPYDTVRIYFTRDRDTLYKRIDKRVDKMIADGLVDEVKSLMDKGLCQSNTSIEALGYKEIVSYLEGKISLDEAVELIKSGSRHYAKRQITWFKRDKEGIWLNLDDFTSSEEIAKRCFDICQKEKLL